MDHIKEYEEFNEGAVKQYLDMNKKPVKVGDLVEVRVVTGRYGQTATYQGKVTKMPEYGKSSDMELDGEYTVTSPFEYDFKTGNMIGYYRHDDYEHGHERWVKKITKLDPKLQAPRRYKPDYTVWLVDYTNGKNKDKSSYQDFPRIASVKGTAEFQEWLAKEYPKAVKKTPEIHKDLVKKYDRDWYKQYPYLQIHQSSPGSSGYLEEYIIGYKK